MALREIRLVGDPILTKKCKEVKEVTPKIRQLVEDMFETMYAANGVGLAAPQVGYLKNIFVVDAGLSEKDPHVFINPEIIETREEQTGEEGCLSVPGKNGDVTRPMYATVRGYDLDMKEFTLETAGLLARAVCHEYDHLQGEMYLSKVQGPLRDNVEMIEDEEEEEV